MTISIHTARHYLDRWGEYMRADRSAGLSLPRIDIVYKMAVGSSDAILINEPRGVEIMQCIYLQMPDQHREVIDISYKDGKPIRKAADKLGIKPGKYREILNNAENYVAGALTFYPDR